MKKIKLFNNDFNGNYINLTPTVLADLNSKMAIVVNNTQFGNDCP